MVYTRRFGEGSIPFVLYCRYRDMGPGRTYRAAALAYLEDTVTGWGTLDPAKRDRLIASWSNRARQYSATFNWVARATQYDMEQEAVRLAKREEAREKARDNQAKAGQIAYGRAIKRLASMEDNEFAAIPPHILVSLLRVGTMIEAEALQMFARPAVPPGGVHGGGGDGGDVTIENLASLSAAIDEYHRTRPAAPAQEAANGGASERPDPAAE